MAFLRNNCHPSILLVTLLTGYAVGNYSLRDYGTFAGLTALCAPYGYYVGEQTQSHLP